MSDYINLARKRDKLRRNWRAGNSRRQFPNGPVVLEGVSYNLTTYTVAFHPDTNPLTGLIFYDLLKTKSLYEHLNDAAGDVLELQQGCDACLMPPISVIPALVPGY